MNKTPRIGFEIRTISNLIKREVDHLEEKTYEGAISGTNRYILLHLANNRDRDIFQKDLEEVFLVRRSTMSSILLRMEEKGLLTRTSVDHDARLKKITLTEKGLRLHKQMEHSIDEMEDRLSSGLSPEDSKTLLVLLEKVRHNLEHEKS
jgi:DNA-binding MarR family transcriptional regulator